MYWGKATKELLQVILRILILYEMHSKFLLSVMDLPVLLELFNPDEPR